MRWERDVAIISSVWWSRVSTSEHGLDDLVELLEGVAKLLMGIDSKLERIQTLLEDE